MRVPLVLAVLALVSVPQAAQAGPFGDLFEAIVEANGGNYQDGEVANALGDFIGDGLSDLAEREREKAEEEERRAEERAAELARAEEVARAEAQAQQAELERQQQLTEQQAQQAESDYVPPETELDCYDGYCFSAGRPEDYDVRSYEHVAALCNVLDQATGALVFDDFGDPDECTRMLWLDHTNPEDMSREKFGPQ